MRRQTMIILIVLTILIVVAAVVQLTMEGPKTPFAGPTSPGELPSPTAQTSPSTAAGDKAYLPSFNR